MLFIWCLLCFDNYNYCLQGLFTLSMNERFGVDGGYIGEFLLLYSCCRCLSMPRTKNKLSNINFALLNHKSHMVSMEALALPVEYIYVHSQEDSTGLSSNIFLLVFPKFCLFFQKLLVFLGHASMKATILPQTGIYVL